jgi:hypothetical protein
VVRQLAGQLPSAWQSGIGVELEDDGVDGTDGVEDKVVGGVGQVPKSWQVQLL